MEEQNLNTGTIAQSIKKHKGWQIAAIALAVVLVGTAGAFAFFAVNSNNEKNELKDTIASQRGVEMEECPENTAEITPEEPIEDLPEEPVVRNFLTIKEWGVKLEIPDGLNHGATYYVGTYGDGPEALVDITSKISLDGDDYSAHAYIIRSRNSSFQPLKYRKIGKIGDYYYFVDEADLIKALLVNATTTLVSAQ